LAVVSVSRFEKYNPGMSDPKPKRARKPKQRPTVLIVDDIDDNRIVLRTFLEKDHDCRVLEAGDGKKALKLAVQESPALILMDIGIPKYGGLVVVEQMRKRRKLRDIPIVAVTAYDSPGLRLDAEKAGITEYVTKPPNPERFRKLIDKYLK
jgi:CheY-like chemotaxis protein